ncbi:hypothetical protein C8R43DRAFT_1009712 [Mycena crocata]|nr:hypothetical protein C8R43DRAFT_1009712 [Mycena crocata]
MSRVVPTIHIERDPNPVIPLFHQATRARLRSALISASLRNTRRPQHQRSASSESASSDDSGCTYASSSDSDSDDSASTSPSRATSCFSSSRTSVANSASKAAELLSTHDAPIYVALPPRSSHTTDCAWRSTRRVPLPIDEDQTHTPVAYVYGGGLTRIMTGGVMLGPRPAAHVVASTRS